MTQNESDPNDPKVKDQTSLTPMTPMTHPNDPLDIWFEKRVKRNGQGYARLIRYADDYVACFQFAEDANQFMHDMEARLNHFHLEVAPEKTKLFEFGKFAQTKAIINGVSS